MPFPWEIIRGFSGFKGRLLLVGGLFVLGGVVLNAGQWLKPKEPSMETGRISHSALRTDWGEESRNALDAAKKRHTWGDAATRLGMSFMVAMVVASLLRVFLRTMVTLLVFGAVAYWFLQSRGMVEASWTEYLSSAEEFRQWALAQTDSVKALLQGYVPSMGAAMVGFGFGLKK